MTEERSCGTCGHYVSDMCVRPGGCCFHHSKWQPIAQKKPMENKVIFESEEEAKKFLDDCIEVRNDAHCDVVNESFYNAKQKGYIRKSAVEEAEEMYIRRAGVVDTLHITQQAAIQELKSEIARLKK